MTSTEGGSNAPPREKIKGLADQAEAASATPLTEGNGFVRLLRRPVQIRVLAGEVREVAPLRGDGGTARPAGAC